MKVEAQNVWRKPQIKKNNKYYFSNIDLCDNFQLIISIILKNSIEIFNTFGSIKVIYTL